MNIRKCEFGGFKVIESEDGIYIGANLPHKNSVSLNIYNLCGKMIESYEFPREFFFGSVLSCYISGLSLKDKLYRFSADGKEIIDSSSRCIYGNDTFGMAILEDKLFSSLPSTNNPKGWDKDKTLQVPYSDAVLYLSHVRGLTMLDDSIKEGKGTYKGVETKASYLKKLGVTSLLLMPVYERIEKRKVSENPKLSYKDINNEAPVNYWGFGAGYYYALKKSYAYSDDVNLEFKKMVMGLHNKGIEVILSFDFADKLSYEEIADILRYWIYEYHIDGFRIFGTNDKDRLVKDPFFKDTKLIFNEYFDALYEIKNTTYKNVAIIDRDAERNYRKFLKSDEDMVSCMTHMVRENHAGFAIIRNVTDFGGFTLNDLVSYDRKHNEDNLEDNTDGANYNYSWNCGAEGETTKKAVLKLRNKQIKNALLLLFLSQGTPMIVAGDECLNSSKGNNNPYCQDNAIGWVEWNKDKNSREVFKFIQALILFRKNHAILHQPFELKGYDYLSCKLPDVSMHSNEAWKVDTNPASRSFSVLLGGDYARQYTGAKENDLLIIFNMHWEAKEFWLPAINKKHWNLLMTSEGKKISYDEINATEVKGETYIVGGREIAILMSSK